MERVRDTASKRQFEGFAAGAADALFRTGYLMTGDPRDAEDLVQETLLRVARRWDQVRSMDHPAAYARRVLINLALRDAERRTRHKAELAPPPAGIEADQEAAPSTPGCCSRPQPCSATSKEITSRPWSQQAASATPTRHHPVSRRSYPSRSSPRQHPAKVTIDPAAIPAGTKLSFGHFQLATSQQTSIALIDAGSYTCTSTAPTALPSGGGALLRYSGGTS
jgi:DNA-directed RNA polymerase specialized sigma24 family protein